MPPCHPYEPGFAPCVGAAEPRPQNPYGPGDPVSVPEPSVAVLVTLAVCAVWRHRKVSR